MGDVQNTVSDTLVFGVIVQGQHVEMRVPAQITPAMAGLPPAESSFTGRSADLEAVLRVLAPHPADATPHSSTAPEINSRAVLVSAVGGMGGIGKTALAVRAASLAVDRGWFSGGVLFVDMFGYDPDRRLTADHALEGFLRAMAVPGEHIPEGHGDRLRLYRSVLDGYANAGCPVLVLVDNASEIDQVLPLMPAHSACRAVVTSRERLASLDARLIDLDVLPADEAVTLLGSALRARLPDDRRLAAEPDAALELADLCAGLPLALRITAALLAENTALKAADLVGVLRPAEERLVELNDGTVDLTTVFDLSYRRLPDDLRQLFSLLPLNPDPGLSAASAAALVGCDPAAARRALNRLARTHLVEPAAGTHRWRLHDLLRLYAQRLPPDSSTHDERISAQDRLLEHYSDTAK